MRTRSKTGTAIQLTTALGAVVTIFGIGLDADGFTAAHLNKASVSRQQCEAVISNSSKPVKASIDAPLMAMANGIAGLDR